MNLIYMGSGSERPEKKPRQRRATPLDPMDVKTWHESDLEQRLKMVLRLGHWRAIHIRKQGDRRHLGREHAGLLETVPPEASWGWPDWFCVPMLGPDVDNELYLELKSERGKVSREQAVWLMLLAQMGHECVVVRPRLTLGDNPMAQRIAMHKPTDAWRKQQVLPDMHIDAVLML